MADLLHVRTRKRDPVATKAARFIDGRSYMSFDSRRWLFGVDMNRQRVAVMERDNFRCTKCQRKPPAYGCIMNGSLEVDHIVSRGLGGSDDLSNLRTLCRSCHSRRHLERTKEAKA